jgi:hypothetical protein
MTVPTNSGILLISLPVLPHRHQRQLLPLVRQLHPHQPVHQLVQVHQQQLVQVQHQHYDK